MSDWAHVDIPQFDQIVATCGPGEAVSRGIFDRLPFAFESKQQYLRWRDELAKHMEVDGRDIILVGSAATGRSLSAQKQFGVFRSQSDIDVAVVSSHHFDLAWRWFRTTNLNYLTGIDAHTKERFNAHRQHYIFDGVVAADIFLGYFPFGQAWMSGMVRCQDLLPSALQGRKLRTRIYRDFQSLRQSQVEAVRSYSGYLQNKISNKADRKERDQDE